MMPSLLFNILRQDLFIWDAAEFGYNSLVLWDTLIHNPKMWISTMFSQTLFRAPLISWIGQFFTPIGEILGSENAGLLFFMFLTSIASATLFYYVLLNYLQNKTLSFIGCLMLISSPSFITFTTHFYTQQLQLLSSTYILYILSNVKKVDPAWTLIHTSNAVAIGLLIKVYTPVFMVIPVLSIIFTIYLNKQKISFDTKEKISALIILFVILTATITWYYITFEIISKYIWWVYSEFSIQQYTFIQNIMYRTWSLFALTFLPETLVILGFMLFIFRKSLTIKKLNYEFFWISSAQIIVSILVFFLIDGRDIFFMHASIPYLCFIFCAILKQLNLKTISYLCIFSLLGQYFLVYGGIFGIIKNQTHEDLYLLNTKILQNQKVGLINELLIEICKNPDKKSDVIIGSNTIWFNTESISFEQYKRDRNQNCKITFYIDLMLKKKLDTENGIDFYLNEKKLPYYFIVLNDTVYKNTLMPFNKYFEVPKVITKKLNEEKFLIKTVGENKDIEIYLKN